jgi:hypothetical protein
MFSPQREVWLAQKPRQMQAMKGCLSVSLVALESNPELRNCRPDKVQCQYVLCHAHFPPRNEEMAPVLSPLIFRLQIPNFRYSSFKRICLGPRLLVIFCNKLTFYGEELTPRPTPKMEDHRLSAVRDCLFSTFAATLPIWRQSPISAI